MGIRESGKINIAVLDHVAAHIKAGMTTAEIDRLVFEKTKELGGVPAPLGYRGFPKSTCTSINEEVCHGIPADDVALKDGDIVNVDVSTIYNSYFSDSSRMFCIGAVSKEKRRLVDVARECVELGLQEVKPWGFLGDMGQAVRVTPENIEAIPTSAYPTPARRPLNSRLDTQKLQSAFGLHLPDWKDGVQRMLAEICGQ